MDKLELYAYTTETYKAKGLVKVGHCIIGRHKTRIREQFGTSNPELPEYNLIGALPEGIEDRHIHAQLIKNDIRKVEDGSGKEWFYASFDDVYKAYNQIVFNSYRLLNFGLRQEQVLAIEKAKAWFLKEYPDEIYLSASHKNRFLINAKMRFGKCFTSIHLAKALNAQKTLIITYKPDVIDEWMDTVNNHIDFDKWIGIRAKRKSSILDPCFNDDGTLPEYSNEVVVCVSLQDLAIEVDGTTKSRLHKILEFNWDLIIFDEVHYGSRTERARFIIDNLNFKWRLDLSGTPFRLIEQDDFCSQQIYTYSYLDEQKNKDIEIAGDPDNVHKPVYRLLPNLNILAIDITEEDLAQQRENFKTDNLDFSLNCLFEVRNGSFVYEEAVDHFIKGLSRFGHEARSISVFGKLGNLLGCPNKRHTVWWLSRIDSITCLIKKLQTHPYFSNFVLINASGSDANKDIEEQIITKDKSRVQKAIKDANSNSAKLGTITFTCGRFLTGVTIKEWDSILILTDVQSAEAYFQAIFRVQSTWQDEKNKTINKYTAWVFDFAISRCLTVIYDCASNLVEQIEQEYYDIHKEHLNDDSLKKTINSLCESLDIKRFYEGSLHSLATTSKDIFDALNFEQSKISLARRITSNILVNFGCLKLLKENTNIFEILERVKGYRTQEVGSISPDELIKIGLDASVLEELKLDPGLDNDEKEKIIDDFLNRGHVEEPPKVLILN